MATGLGPSYLVFQLRSETRCFGFALKQIKTCFCKSNECCFVSVLAAGWHHNLPKVINFPPHGAKISSKRSGQRSLELIGVHQLTQRSRWRIITSLFLSSPSAGVCGTPRECPAHEISFYIHSGAANVVPPAICVQNKL